MNLNGAFYRYLIRYFDMQTHFESNESKWCNAINLNGALCSLFNTIFLISREKLKAMNLNGAF